MTTTTHSNETLLEDERGRGFAAVVRAGPYLFLSGSEGQRSPGTETIDSGLTWQPEAQTRNSYERMCRRLQRCGYGPECVVWLEHFVSSQEWLLLRLALWRDRFGVERTAGAAVAAVSASDGLRPAARATPARGGD